MSRFRSLRVQVAGAATLVVAVVVALAGVFIAAGVYRQDRAQVDDQLTERATKVLDDLTKGRTGSIDGDQEGEPPDGTEGNLLAGSDTLSRVISDGTVLDQRGELTTGEIPIPDAVGFTTVDIDGQDWRSLVITIENGSDDRLQVLQSLGPVNERLRDNRRLIALVGAAAVALTAAGAWVAAALVMRPLQRLRTGAVSIGTTLEPPAQLPEPSSPQEVTDLAAALNAMLTRLGSTMEATRRFTADAGHELRSPLTALGMDLETLRRHPELSPAERDSTLAAMATEHARVVRLLDGLLGLARGDAQALPEREQLDVDDLLANAAEAARRRHPSVTFHVGESSGGTVSGWPDGLRLAVDNLLNNSALHGRPDGQVELSAQRAAGTVLVSVTDDGPGIAQDELDLVTGRFVRGSANRSSGSGLGLALVEQQAALHGGSLTLSSSPSGGLSVTISIDDG